MSKVCLITDTHFGVNKNSELMLKSSMDFFDNQLIPFLKEKSIDTIFILGDIFDNRNFIKTIIHEEVYELFNTKLKDFKIYAILGNHDCIYESTTEAHSLKFLKKFDNVTVVDRNATHVTIDNKDILLVPWMHNQNDILDIFQENEADIVMGHFDITGFNFNKWTLSHSGISPDHFSGRYGLVFSGHFHTRTNVSLKGTQFVYVGSPYQMTKVDIDEERGFVILDVEKMKYKYFTNEVSTKFVKVVYPESISESTIKNNRVELHIHYNKESYSPDEYDKYIQQVSSHCPAELEIFYADKSVLATDFDISAASISNPKLLMKSYVEKTEIVNKNKVYLKLIELYDNAKGEE